MVSNYSSSTELEMKLIGIGEVYTIKKASYSQEPNQGLWTQLGKSNRASKDRISARKECHSNCDTVTLLPLVILHLEPHHMTPESTERSALN
jgi:hypothetical protein